MTPLFPSCAPGPAAGAMRARDESPHGGNNLCIPDNLQFLDFQKTTIPLGISPGYLAPHSHQGWRILSHVGDQSCSQRSWRCDLVGSRGRFSKGSGTRCDCRARSHLHCTGGDRATTRRRGGGNGVRRASENLPLEPTGPWEIGRQRGGAGVVMECGARLKKMLPFCIKMSFISEITVKPMLSSVF